MKKRQLTLIEQIEEVVRKFLRGKSELGYKPPKVTTENTILLAIGNPQPRSVRKVRSVRRKGTAYLLTDVQRAEIGELIKLLTKRIGLTIKEQLDLGVGIVIHFFLPQEVPSPA